VDSRHERVRECEREPEEGLGVGLPLGVEPERHRAAAPQRVVDEEVERAEVRELVALDRADPERLEVMADALGGEHAGEEVVPFLAARDDADVDEIALVARAAVRDEQEPSPHDVKTSTRGTTWPRWTRPDQIPRTGDARGRGPA
jgi:hypothetical protein